MRHYSLLVGVTLITLSSAYAGFKATSKTTSVTCTNKAAGVLDLGDCLDVAAAADASEIDPAVLNQILLVPNPLCVEIRLKNESATAWSTASSGFTYEKEEVSGNIIKGVSLGSQSDSKRMTLKLDGLNSGRLSGTFSNHVLYDQMKDPPVIAGKFFLNSGTERDTRYGDEKGNQGFNNAVFFFGRPAVVEDSDEVSVTTCKKLKLATIASFKPEMDQCYWIDGKETVKVDGKDLPVCW